MSGFIIRNVNVFLDVNKEDDLADPVCSLRVDENASTGIVATITKDGELVSFSSASTWDVYFCCKLPDGTSYEKECDNGAIDVDDSTVTFVLKDDVTEREGMLSMCMFKFVDDDMSITTNTFKMRVLEAS